MTILFRPETPSQAASSPIRPAAAGVPHCPASGLARGGVPISAPLPARKLTLTILVLVFAVNFMDRQILAILLEPIKRDLDLTDAELGLLYGLAFAAVYSTVAIPIARWADRASRVKIITGSLALFSLMTLLCGLAVNYWQLLLARIGVGIGEGGTNPASHSIISDLYPVERRSTAMAIFALGPHMGILLGFLVGGWLGQLWSWRVAFIVAGLAGLVLAAITLRLLKEPPRGHVDGVTMLPEALPRVSAVRESLLRYASMRHLFAGSAVCSIAAYAVIGWLPAFLIRTQDMSTSAAGTVLALLLGAIGGAGTLLGGVLADRMGARDSAWRLRVVAIALLSVIPCWAAALFVDGLGVVLGLLLIPSALLGFYLGPSFAMVQSLVTPTMRALAAALLLLVANLIGLGLGPLVVGVVSDSLQATHGPDSLRLALLVLLPLYCWGAYHYHAAARTISRDLAAHQSGT
ncbi:MAG TPA: MFS transporter [Burkholderiales bacterium]|nr:MFS transporter [Burkholderiales bacterium]